MVDTLEARLRAELHDLRADVLAGGAATDATAGSGTGGRLVAAGRRRAQRRRARGVAVSLAACLAVVAGGVALTRPTGGEDSLRSDLAGEGATSMRIPGDGDDGPSQSPEDAARDGVDPAVAALPLATRAHEPLLVEVGGPAWVAAQLAPDAFGDDPCSLTSPVCVFDYSELLLLDTEGRIERAYPFPGLVVDWIDVTEDEVHAGAVGDGGQPDSALIRIDRATGEATVVVLAHEDGVPVDDWPPDWLVPTPTIAMEALGYVHTEPQPDDAPVTSRIGDLWVDMAAVDQFIDAISGSTTSSTPTG